MIGSSPKRSPSSNAASGDGTTVEGKNSGPTCITVLLAYIREMLWQSGEINTILQDGDRLKNRKNHLVVIFTNILKSEGGYKKIKWKSCKKTGFIVFSSFHVLVYSYSMYGW